MVDLDKLRFSLEYHPPRIDEPCEDRGVYEIRAELGEAPPSVLQVESISRARLAVYPEKYWSAVEVDPIAETIAYIDRVLWKGWGKKAERLSEARLERYTR